ncbi:unnamed protein product [marine sediment metagenome]|uniref:Uncharacterized protein n=1 Tax=marine sediment metagenome TaxID=412755 RepID=X1EU94_9ZZZZ
MKKLTKDMINNTTYHSHLEERIDMTISLHKCSLCGKHNIIRHYISDSTATGYGTHTQHYNFRFIIGKRVKDNIFLCDFCSRMEQLATEVIKLKCQKKKLEKDIQKIKDNVVKLLEE